MLSFYRNTKLLPTLGTLTADKMCIDTGVTFKTDFVPINGDSRRLRCSESAEKLDLLLFAPSHGVFNCLTPSLIKDIPLTLHYSLSFFVR